MPEAWTQGMINKAFWIHRQKPKYVSDYRITPDEALKKLWIDCSMFDYLSAHLAGILGIERVDAASMRKGRGGWRGRDLPGKLLYAKPGTLPFYKWIDRKTGKPKPSKLIDHTGIHVRDPISGDPAVLHASSGRLTTVVAPIAGVFVTDLAAVRELTIGDPIGTKK